MNDDHVVISDHAYSYHGTLSKDHLMKAARSVYEHTPRTENRYKWIKQVDLEKEPEVMKVLKEHVAILEGHRHILNCLELSQVLTQFQSFKEII